MTVARYDLSVQSEGIGESESGNADGAARQPGSGASSGYRGVTGLGAAPVRVRARPRRYFGWRSAASASVAVLAAALAFAAAAQAQDQDEEDRHRIRDLRGQREQLALSKAKAVTHIDMLLVDDQTLLDALRVLDEQSEKLRLQTVGTEQEIEAAETAFLDARRESEMLLDEIENIREDLQQRAIDVFVQPTEHVVEQLATDSLGRSAVKLYLLEQVVGSEMEIADELRVAEEKLAAERRRAIERASVAAELRKGQIERLSELHQFQNEAISLREEYQSRIDGWKSVTIQIELDDLNIASEIASIEAAIRQRELERQRRAAAARRQAAEARRRAAEEARRQAEARDGPFQLIVWPARGRITSGFGLRRHPIFGIMRAHNGIDIDGDTGDRVMAARSGNVVITGWRGGYGNTVVVSHGLGYSTLYAHLSAISVSVGDAVASGDVIGALGSTGWSTGPHLHFELRIDGRAVDPLPFLPG